MNVAAIIASSSAKAEWVTPICRQIPVPLSHDLPNGLAGEECKRPEEEEYREDEQPRDH
jgi:hypothetical protein